MSVDIRNHPDAPDPESLQDILVEPVSREEIEREREAGSVLVEDNVREREDLNVIAYLSPDPDGSEDVSVGVGLYRLVQLFGTPQLPEYHAGEDISDRTDETFKYLFRARREVDDELPEEWLFTVHDSHVRYAASVAEWRDQPGEFAADDDVALATYALAQQLVVEPVEAVYEGVPY
ncbi:hypothetical protein [Halorussus amylolyticus]|uniref:hypothetical protein n=1 Tax=Halorussus amylolyticus TaxID=1126242 RepID=UPI00104B335A|nr:hypothetical protein [Halorussus amylolyticus]